MRRYTTAYVPTRRPSVTWLAGMLALVCAGLESSTCLNFDGDSRRMRAYALGATGDRSINSCTDSRRIRAYARVYARIEYKPGFTGHRRYVLRTPGNVTSYNIIQHHVITSHITSRMVSELNIFLKLYGTYPQRLADDVIQNGRRDLEKSRATTC